MLARIVCPIIKHPRVPYVRPVHAVCHNKIVGLNKLGVWGGEVGINGSERGLG